MPPQLRWPILLSIFAAVLTIGMKTVAYSLTGSVGLFSDALESLVNLLAAVTAYVTLIFSGRPADSNHTYGHEKLEFFSSGVEGGLIVVAGLSTGIFAATRFLKPQPLVALEHGVSIVLAATAVNLIVARVLLHYGQKHRSIVLEADGRHLMSDVWTSIAVVAGLWLVIQTGISVLDPILAIAVGVNIIRTGVVLMRRSFDGLMDHALPPEIRETIRGVVRARLPAGASFHALRTRAAGARRFAEFHLLVDGEWTVRSAHHLAHTIEDDLLAAVPGLEVVIHVEPVDEQESFETEKLRQLGEEEAPASQSP